MAEPVQRILVITLSNIGDAVMTTPVLEFLHRRWPDARVDLVGDARSSALFAACPYLGRLVLRDKNAGWRGRLALIRELRRTRYDLVVDPRTDGLAWLLRARRRLTKWHRGPHGPHAVEDHMAVLARINPDGGIPATHLWLDAVHTGFADQAVADLPGTRWLALGPGANWLPKTWSVARFGELAKLVRDDFDALVLVGGPGDRERCETIAAGAPLPALDLAGGTGLLEAAAVLARCAAFVGNDSGLGHMAAAVGIPTLTVFGPGRPERYHPWGPNSAWLVSPTGNIDDLDAATVAERLRTLVAAP